MARVRNFILILVLLVPLGVHAETIIRTGDRVSVEAEQNVAGDFYAAGGKVSISGTIEGDLYAAGASVTINGPVSEDLVAAGGIVDVHAPVGDDVRLAGSEMVIADHVAGDVLVFGDSLQVLSTAEIDGDLMFFGRELEMNGVVHGNVSVTAERVRIDGAVDQDVSVTSSGQLSLGERAHIDGELIYGNTEDLLRAQGAVVVGDVQHRSVAEVSGTSGFGIASVLIVLFSSLVYLLFFRRYIEQLVGHVTHSFGLMGLIGLGVLILVPVGVALLLFSVLGILVGVSAFFLYALLLLLAWSLSGILAGALIAKLVVKKFVVNWKWTIAGVIALQLLMFIPVLGFLAGLTLTLMVLGGIAHLLYRKLT